MGILDLFRSDEPEWATLGKAFSRAEVRGLTAKDQNISDREVTIRWDKTYRGIGKRHLERLLLSLKPTPKHRKGLFESDDQAIWLTSRLRERWYKVSTGNHPLALGWVIMKTGPTSPICVKVWFLDDQAHVWFIDPATQRICKNYGFKLYEFAGL